MVLDPTKIMPNAPSNRRVSGYHGMSVSDFINLEEQRRQVQAQSQQPPAVRKPSVKERLAAIFNRGNLSKAGNAILRDFDLRYGILGGNVARNDDIRREQRREDDVNRKIREYVASKAKKEAVAGQAGKYTKKLSSLNLINTDYKKAIEENNKPVRDTVGRVVEGLDQNKLSDLPIAGKRFASQINKGEYGLAPQIFAGRVTLPIELASSIGDKSYTNKQRLGMAALTAAEYATFAKIGKLGKLFGLSDETEKAIKTIGEVHGWERAGQVLKSVAKGSGVGALGAGGYAAYENRPNNEIAKSAAVGGALGAGFGALEGLVSTKVQNNLSKNQQIQKALQEVSDAYEKPQTYLQSTNNKTGEISFFAIDPKDTNSVIRAVDDAKKGIAGKQVGDYTFHITTKSRGGMERAGAKFAGTTSRSALDNIVDDVEKTASYSKPGAKSNLYRGKVYTSKLTGEYLENNEKLTNTLREKGYVAVKDRNGKIIPLVDDAAQTGESKNIDRMVKQLTTKNEMVDDIGEVADASVIGKAVGKNKTVGAVIQGGMERLKASGSVSARKFGAKLNEYFRLKSAGVNQFKDLTEEVNKLTAKQFDEQVVNKILNGQAKDGLALKVKTVLEDYLNTKFPESGISVRELKNYFPKIVDQSQKQNIMKWIQNEIAEGRIKVGEGESSEDIFKMLTREVRPKKFGFEFSRANIELPDNFYLKDNRAIFAQYIDSAEDKIALAKVFGNKFQGFEELRRGALIEGGQETVDLINNIMETSLYGVKKPVEALRAVGAYNVATKLGGAVWKNITQVGNDVTTAGFTRVGKATKLMATDGKKAEKIALDAGVNVNSLHEYLIDLVRSGNKKDPLVSTAQFVLDATQFNRVERWNRIRSANAANFWFDDMAKAVKNGKLKDSDMRYLEAMGIRPQQLVNATQEVRNRFIYNHVGMNQFYINPLTMQVWSQSSALGKQAVQFRAFSINQQRLINQRVIGEAAHGNFAPMLRYIGFNIPAGQVVNAAKFGGMIALINYGMKTAGIDFQIEPRKRKTELADVNDAKTAFDWSKESMDYSGGLGIIDDMVSSAQYSRDNEGKFDPQQFLIKQIGGVSAGEAYDSVSLISEGIDAARGKSDMKQFEKKAIKKAAGMVPFFSPYIKQGLDPYNPNDSKYFDEKNKILNSLTPTQKATWKAIHPKADEVRGIMFSEQKASSYLNNKELFDADKKIAEISAKYYGNEIDPFFKLSWDKAQKVLFQGVKGDGWNSKELRENYKWYPVYLKMRSNYFDNSNFNNDQSPLDKMLGITKEKPLSERDQYYVEASPYVQSLLDRGETDDPAVQEFFDKQTAAKNAFREAAGAVTPDRYSLQNELVYERGGEMAKQLGSKLKYMQAIRMAGMGYEDFFEAHPELDPLKGAPTKGLGSSSGYSRYSKKGGGAKFKKAKQPKYTFTKPLKSTSTKSKYDSQLKPRSKY